LSIKNNIKKERADFHPADENEAAIEKKLNELIDLISKSDIDSETAKAFKQRFDHAINKPGISRNQLNPDDMNALQGGLTDDFGILLSNSQFHNKPLKKYRVGIRLSNIVLFAISITMITLGFGMIIMPAPPFFEMFTIFYFNPNDGITIMDLISLIVILAGVYFLIKAIYRDTARTKQL